MAKKSLYFNEKSVTPLKSLPDALGRELHKDDFVTAVFSDAELTLFKIVGFEKHVTKYFMDYGQLDHDQDKGIVLNRTEKNEYLVLQRVQGTNAFSGRDDEDAKKHNAKLVYKTSKQVAFADPSYVMLHYFGLKG